jgi:tripartite-type tricarboxylate transporter receptor subunit TctC
MTVPNVVVVHPTFPAATIAELIAYAKVNPGKVNMGSAGNGSAGHLAGELFMAMTGINMVHVPYRGVAPAIADLLSGQVHVLFATSVAAMEYVRTGKLRALAVTTAGRAEALPGLPTVADTVPGYEASAWYGMGAPKRAPAEIIDKLNRETNAGLANAKLKAKLADLGGTLIPGAPGDFAKLIAEETEKWGKVIRTANIKI